MELLPAENAAAAYENELRLRYATRELTAAMLEGCPFAEIAESITTLLAQILPAERIGLFLRDTADVLRSVHLRNLSPEVGEGAARLAAQHPQVVRAMSSGVPCVLRDFARQNAAETLRDLMRSENIGDLLIAPLHYSPSVRGLLIVYPEAERDFSDEERATFQSFANMATLGVAMSQQIEQQRLLAQTAERNRLAREMHDTVAQSLAGLIMQLETAQNYLNLARLEDAAELLTQSRFLAKKALEDTRRAVQGLTAALLEHLTPAQAIAGEVKRFESEHGIASQFVLSGAEQALSQEQQVTLLRIVQECLANARRHALPNRVRVGLQFEAGEVLLRVEDDGAGFDTDALAAPGPEGGYGLFGIRERARLLGGAAKIESTPGWGTRILAQFPVHAVAPAIELVYAAPESLGILPDFGAAPPDTAPVLRVLLADDHAVTRQGLRALLEGDAGIEIVGEAADGVEAEEQTLLLRPDVVLMDVQMPHRDGLESLRRIRAALPDQAVVVLTSFQTDETLREALRAGARGYLLKTADAADLLAAIRAAFRGETMLSAGVSERLSVLAQGQSLDLGDRLNERALEVLNLLAQGLRNKEIAAKLFISERTVEYHLSNIFLKLGVTNRTEAARAALSRGLVAAQ